MLGGGARHRVSKESSHGFGSVSCDMTIGEGKCCSSISRPYGRTTRAPKDPRRQFRESANNTSHHLSLKRSIDDVLAPLSHPLPCFVNNFEWYNNNNNNNNNNNKKSHGKESFAGWKKWIHSERFSLQGLGKTREKNASIGEFCATRTKETRKKKRLSWGEGLAKFEKKKCDEGNGSPEVTGSSDCATSAATTTPTSVAYNSLRASVGDTLCVKAANVGNDVSNLGGSLGLGSQNHRQIFLERIDVNSLTSLGSSLVELLESDNPSSADSSLARSTAMSKLLIWKAVISKVLEVTETEIDSLENELKSLQSESGDRLPCSGTASSLPVCYSIKSCDEDIGGSDKVTCLEPWQISLSREGNVEKMPLSTNLQISVHDNSKEDYINSTGTATSKFVEALPMIKAVSSCDATRYGNFAEDLDGHQSTAKKCFVPCSYGQVAKVSACGDDNSSLSMEIKDGMDANSSASFYSSTDATLYNTIISSNKESAKRAWEVFSRLLPKECGKISNVGVSSSSLSHNDAFIKEKFAEKKWFARFKEKVLTIKYEALDHLWKKDICLRSLRKRPQTSLRKKDRFPFPAGNQLSLVPTSDMINYTSQLLSESQYKFNRSISKMPALILDQKDKMISKFKSSNGLVEDPLAIEKERAMINPWTSEERKILWEKFEAFGKDFRKIASFLDHKTTADCAEFYYKNHKPDCFEKIKKKEGGKSRKLCTAKTGLMASSRKRNCKVNVDSLETLSEAPMMARGTPGNRRTRSGRLVLRRGYDNMKISTGDDSITERSNSLDILQGEREIVAAEALVGMSGSLASKAMSSFITRSVDPVEANRDRSYGEINPSDWTDEEKVAFLQAVSSFGKDFTMIAQRVGTRPKISARYFFQRVRTALDWTSCTSPEYIGSLVNDVNGGRNDIDDACVVEADSVISSDKSDEDYIMSLVVRPTLSPIMGLVVKPTLSPI